MNLKYMTPSLLLKLFVIAIPSMLQLLSGTLPQFILAVSIIAFFWLMPYLDGDELGEIFAYLRWLVRK